MSLFDPTVEMMCDECQCSEYLNLTATAGGGYDERNFDADIKSRGWTTDGDSHYCDECSKNRDSS